jgi:hypothetical protein
MVRWIDGLYGGLIAGMVSAIFYFIAGLTGRGAFGDYFVRSTAAIFGPRAESIGIVAVLFGLFVHLVAAAAFGLVYAAIAARFKPMWKAPSSVVCGICYGLFMYFVAEDVLVPIFRVVSYTPAWEALVGSVLFTGVVLAEYITISFRRNLAAGMA